MLSVAQATQWWVSATGGSTGNCSTVQGSNDPGIYIRTINQAIACVSNALGAGAGSTIMVKSGAYAESFDGQSARLPSGTSWTAPFTIKSEVQYGAVIRNSGGSNIIHPGGLAGAVSMYLVIDGFTFDGINLSDTQFYFGTANYLKIQNNDVINTPFTGMEDGPGTNHQILNNKWHGGPFAGRGASNAPYSIVIYLDGSDGLFEGNEVYNYPGWGLQVYSGLGNSPDNYIVRNNTFHDGGWGTACPPGCIQAKVAIVNYGSDNAKIHNNVVHDITGVCFGVGPGVNVIYYNNTCYNTTNDGAGGGIGGINGTNSGVLIKNNIFWNTFTTAIEDTAHASNNLCPASCGSFSITNNPNFTNAGAGDFTLASNSPAIDAGTANIAPGFVIPACSGGTITYCYNGKAPDIGAFESGVPSVGGTPPTLRPNPPTGIIIGMIISAVAQNDDGTRRTANVGDYVGLYVPGAASTSFIDWFYMNGTKTAPSVAINDAVLLFTAPSAVGSYEFRFYQNGSISETDRLATAGFTVGPKGLVFRFNGASVVKMAGTGQTVKVGVP